MSYCEPLLKEPVNASDNIPKNTICANCKKHKGTHVWVGEGGTLAWIHGEHQIWCECCIVKAQLAYAENLSKNIPKLQNQLRTLICK